MLVEHKKGVSVDMATQDLRIRSLQNTHVIKRLLLCGHLLGLSKVMSPLIFGVQIIMGYGWLDALNLVDQIVGAYTEHATTIIRVELLFRQKERQFHHLRFTLNENEGQKYLSVFS